MISCAERGIGGGTVSEQFDQTFFLCAGADWAEDRPVGRILACRPCRLLVPLKKKLVPLWCTPNCQDRSYTPL